MSDTRKAFEDWISAPPFEREVKRFGDESAWPGNYRELDVDLAWCAWSDAVAAERQRWLTVAHVILSDIEALPQHMKAAMTGHAALARMVEGGE